MNHCLLLQNESRHKHEKNKYEFVCSELAMCVERVLVSMQRASACVLIGALAIIQHIVCRFGSIGIIHKKTRLFIDDGLWK